MEPKKFNIQASDVDELSLKLQELENTFREDFRATEFKVNHKMFTAAAACYKDPSLPQEATEKCVETAFGISTAYETARKQVVFPLLDGLRLCMQKCKSDDLACNTVCMNTFANTGYARLLEFNSKYSI